MGYDKLWCFFLLTLTCIRLDLGTAMLFGLLCFALVYVLEASCTTRRLAFAGFGILLAQDLSEELEHVACLQACTLLSSDNPLQLHIA